MQACHISRIAQRGWAMATLPDLTNGWQAGAPTSAMLAMRTHHAVQRFACLACLQQVTDIFRLQALGTPVKLVWRWVGTAFCSQSMNISPKSQNEVM